jgi:hypothetical protein
MRFSSSCLFVLKALKSFRPLKLSPLRRSTYKTLQMERPCCIYVLENQIENGKLRRRRDLH